MDHEIIRPLPRGNPAAAVPVCPGYRLALGMLFSSLLIARAGASDPPVRLAAHAGEGGANVRLLLGETVLLKSPAEGLWSIAMDWQDDWPTGWVHGSPASYEQVGDWTILRGRIRTPAGDWEISDAYRPFKDTIQGIRRFEWKGREAARRCTLSVRFLAPGEGDNVVLPGILYHGNPSGARSGRVPVYTGMPGEEAFYEEHRFPMPYASFEWASADGWRGAALHSLPCPTPFGHRPDQWWSLGCRALGGATELALLSGPCASNGRRSVIKERQRGFEPYSDAWLEVPPGGIVEKTFRLQVYPVAAEGRGFGTATRACLDLFEPYGLHGLPEFRDIITSKYRFSQTRWHAARTGGGFCKYPNADQRPFFVIGWCGQAAAPGYALQVLGDKLGAANADEQVVRSLNTVAQARFYDGGFHTWYDFKKDEWSNIEPLSQGQGMHNMANAIRVARGRGLDTAPWEAFLRHACDVHADRILAAGWTPPSTSEGFFIAPLCQGRELFGEKRYLAAARKAGEVLAQRHLAMREPYWGGTLDASCEDKEGAYAALQGFLALYEATHEPRYLEWAGHALDVVLTYVVVWDMDLPAGRLRDHAFTTRGWTAVSVQNMHIDAYGVLMTPEVYRLGGLLGRPDLQELALVMFRSCGQLIDPYGSQGEQPQHTNYVQGGDMTDPARFRGGYHETWTVFWITAHFLNAAAQLQEMGVPIWK
ncbi:MAG: hypothetical protein H7A45_06355 [Verrucomicrobiales bacterium]|nr:hypothetical protein [Verrucomicrobiales bacterium]